MKNQTNKGKKDEDTKRGALTQQEMETALALAVLTIEAQAERIDALEEQFDKLYSLVSGGFRSNKLPVSYTTG